MAITPTDKGGRWRLHWGAMAVSLTLGIGLLATAPARFQSELFLFGADRLIQAAETGTAVAPDMLEAATRQAEREAERSLSTRAADMAGRGQVLLALYHGPDSPAGQAALSRARAAFHARLAEAPLAAPVWSRLAYAEYASHRFHEAVQAWHMSVRTGPFEHQLIPLRFDSGLALHPYMDVASRRAFTEQIRLYAIWNIHGLTERTLRYGVQDIVRPALAADPALLAELDRLLPLMKARQ